MPVPSGRNFTGPMTVVMSVAAMASRTFSRSSDAGASSRAAARICTHAYAGPVMGSAGRPIFFSCAVVELLDAGRLHRVVPAGREHDVVAVLAEVLATRPAASGRADEEGELRA